MFTNSLTLILLRSEICLFSIWQYAVIIEWLLICSVLQKWCYNSLKAGLEKTIKLSSGSTFEDSQPWNLVAMLWQSPRCEKKSCVNALDNSWAPEKSFVIASALATVWVQSFERPIENHLVLPSQSRTMNNNVNKWLLLFCTIMFVGEYHTTLYNYTSFQDQRLLNQRV